ncbi:MAG: ATPase [Lachnospiraceae bacterium]|nr:ATPase [Lachnospiraceae bacterium]
MVEKMKFLSITGHKGDIDRVIDQYLSRYEIHLENALSELKTVPNLKPFTENNPYKEELLKAEELIRTYLGGPQEKKPVSSHSEQDQKLTIEKAARTVQAVNEELSELAAEKEQLEKELEVLRISEKQINPFIDLNYDVRSILQFKYVGFRFGRFPHEYYKKFVDYVYDTIDVVMHKCQEDEKYVWVVYFVPKVISDKMDAILASLHFERFFLADEYEGTPTEASQALKEKIDALLAKIQETDQKLSQIIQAQKTSLLNAYQKLERYSTNFDVRKLAACTSHESHTFYILCGWMGEADAAAFQKELENDPETFSFMEDDHNNIMSNPPTRLKNPGIFKPFEMFIQMYGLPAYGEIDPTILMGLTYSFLFGFMFGDAGQGICLMVGGFLLYQAKKMDLAAIISCCGFFSTIFGFLFGSVFGFENVIEAIWLHPKNAMTKLPFIGNLNTVFVVAIALGMGIVLLTMILNVINSLRSHDPEKAYFDTNGIAGIVFYAALAATVFLYMTNHPLPAAAVLTVMFLLPLLVILFKEPLAALVEKKAEVMPEQKGMFFVQGFFELFEVLLSYFSNTLSFVRVGAFAVSHAAMMEVVLMLAGVEAGSPNWVVIILGNLFVCGMEGLIVGIQVLRLEYYELFSRFYGGTGRAFKPYGKTDIQ